MSGIMSHANAEARPAFQLKILSCHSVSPAVHCF